MKTWKRLLLSAMMAVGLVGVLAPTLPAYAAPKSNDNLIQASCKENGNAGPLCKKASKNANVFSMIKTAINVVLSMIGIVAVIMLIIGGFRYVVSAGEAAAVKSAKNTILYAIVGLVVAILAFTIVNFVVGKF